MKITKEWLQKENACIDGLEWFTKQNKEFEPVPLLNLLIKKNQLDWTNWLVVRVMNYSQYVSYAVYAAEQVIKNYEKQYPDDKRPREAIEAAKKCIENPSDENKKTADSAASAAAGASCAVYSAARLAYWAAWAASRAAWAAGWAAYSASSAAAEAASAADSAEYWLAYSAADWAAGRAACAADRTAKSAKILKKILKYVIELLTGGK